MKERLLYQFQIQLHTKGSSFFFCDRVSWKEKKNIEKIPEKSPAKNGKVASFQSLALFFCLCEK